MNICANLVKKITVFVDMGDIQKSWRSVSDCLKFSESNSLRYGTLKRRTGASEDEDEGQADHYGVNDVNGLTELERELARFRHLLEKKYANEHDAGYTFLANDDVTLPLTPLMMKEWSRACVSAVLNHNASMLTFLSMKARPRS